MRGNAFAEAEASLQVQFPLNLFQSFGSPSARRPRRRRRRASRWAWAWSWATSSSSSSGIPEAIGIPLELVLLLLEEVDFGGKFEVHVAASAMAYASLQITGTIIDRPGQPAGFQYLVDAGLGLAAGMGFSGGLASASRTSATSTAARWISASTPWCATSADLLADDPPAVRAVAGAFGPVAKVALRLAYELGDFIAKNNPGSDAAQTLANHSVGILLEETQRFLLERFVEAGLTRRAAWCKDSPRPRPERLGRTPAAAPGAGASPLRGARGSLPAHHRQSRLLAQPSEEMLALADGLPAGVRDTVKQGAASAGPPRSS